MNQIFLPTPKYMKYIIYRHNFTWAVITKMHTSNKHLTFPLTFLKHQAVHQLFKLSGLYRRVITSSAGGKSACQNKFCENWLTNKEIKKKKTLHLEFSISEITRFR